MARKKKTKKIKKTKISKKNKSKTPAKIIEKKSVSQNPDEKPEIKKIKKQATEKKAYNLKDFVVTQNMGLVKLLLLKKLQQEILIFSFIKFWLRKKN